MSYRVIDLDREIFNLFSREEMFAFFDFLLKLGQDMTTCGLCKVSTPKEKDSKSQYVSLFFMIDTPSDSIRKEVEGFVKSISWDNLSAVLPEISSVLSIPTTNPETDIYFREIDLYMKGRHFSRSYLENRLYPELMRMTGLKGDCITFWDDFSAEQIETKVHGKAEDDQGNSFFERLKKLFGASGNTFSLGS